MCMECVHITVLGVSIALPFITRCLCRWRKHRVGKK